MRHTFRSNAISPRKDLQDIPFEHPTESSHEQLLMLAVMLGLRPGLELLFYLASQRLTRALAGIFIDLLDTRDARKDPDVDDLRQSEEQCRIVDDRRGHELDHPFAPLRQCRPHRLRQPQRVARRNLLAVHR